MFLIFMQLAVISIFKSYPTVGDVALYMAFLPLWSHLHRCECVLQVLAFSGGAEVSQRFLFSSPEEHLPGVLRPAGLLGAVPGPLAPLDLRRQRQLQLLLRHNAAVQRGAGKERPEGGAVRFS